ncbi:flocculation protein FLO11-like isoform X2 [Homarus americanus]|uniref:Erbin-like n=1 Tax=Homarus americanus TaxID=6706 RepID=A0A8J5KG64_HOMAM|nr:flocculation protein FLO11-like isoform X2 [Homarus americanus]KAG7170200.1 Erbin-like [Homarus americanus]
MPSLFACFGCGGGGESDDIRTLDYCHCSLNDVPSDVFACERTLEELYLDSNQLSELPRQLFYCHGLRILGLSDNELTSLPPAVASLITLTNIDLSKNAISDIPDHIKGCKQLSVVDASINPLCRLPEGFTQLLSLQELYLNDTFLEYLPANFGRLSRLKILELRENQLNTLPKSIARLTSLQRLDVGQNDFSELPEVIGSLENLTELWFDNNKIKSLPPLLGRLKKLVHVDASKNKVDWVAGEVENCVMLTDLHLSSNNLKELPEKLGGCQQLQVLKLDDNALTHLPESVGCLAALEELVVTQNELETLPASMGLLRALHTLHVDDNLLTELPPELGSCSQLTVLTAASNRLMSVPAELGHLPRLAILNLCDNLILHLPVSLTKLKLRALWLSENQNKPQVQLQSETLPETGQRVLTCFMLPQQPRVLQPETVVETDNFPGQSWDEQRRAKTLIKFAFDGDVDKPGLLTRAPTPYPKELKALAKHARNLHSLQRDPGRQFVLGRSQDSNKTSSSSIIPSTKDETEIDSSRKGNDIALKQPLLDQSGNACVPVDDSLEAEEITSPLTVIEPQAEERPLLREARNVRNTYGNMTSASAALNNKNNASLSNVSKHVTPDTAMATDRPYAIGDRKMFGHAQVVAMTQSRDKVVIDPSKPVVSGMEESRAQVAYPTHESSPPLSQETTIAATPSSATEGELAGDVSDKRIKKPPPYHIAAVMSRHAADFNESSVEVSSAPSGIQGSTGLTVKDLPTSQQNSAASPAAEDENNDTSSSSDSGYGNGKISSQQITDDQHCSDGSSINTPLSPQNLTDSALSMPSTLSSPLGSADVVSPHSVKSFNTPMSLSSKASSLSASVAVSSNVTLPVSSQSLAAPQNISSAMSLSFPVSCPSYDNFQNPITSRSGEVSYPVYSVATSNARPASIATGTQLEHCSARVPHRPGSLALGTLADSALLNRLPRDQRPGSLAAPINTLGIPPAPARAVSHMGLNVTSPTRPHDLSMFKNQDLTPTRRGWTPDQQSFGGTTNHWQESNGLVSIIDQVTSSLLEHGDSPPPNMLASKVVPSSNTMSVTPVPSVGYSQITTHSGIYESSRKASVTSVNAFSSGVHLSSGSGSECQDSSRSSVGGVGSSVGPTNFTQDQPRGEVLHPTPHRPHLSSSSSRLTHESLQDAITSAQDTPSDLQQAAGHELRPEAPQAREGVNGVGNAESTLSSIKAAPKPLSRIPSRSPETALPVKNLQKDSPISSHSSHLHHESRIPTLGSMGRSPSSETHSSVESRIPTPGNMGTSPGGLTQESRVTSHSHIPSLNSKGPSSSNLTHDKHILGESRIPMLSSVGRTPSNLTHDSQIYGETLKPVGYSPSAEPHNMSDSRIPVIGMMGRTSSNLTRESLGMGAGKHGSPDVITGNKNFTPNNKSQIAGSPGSNGSGIPSLVTQGRSSSNLSSNIPSPGTVSIGMQSDASKHQVVYGYASKPQNLGDTGQMSSPSRLHSPGYSTGIRPPTIHSPNQQQPSHQPQVRGYPSGIRPPTVNAAINTPGIPIPSPASPTSQLMNPGSRGSVTSTGSASRIPMAAGGAASRLPTPGTNKLRMSPSVAPSPDGSKTNHSAWMFGQHKNARVFPVVIEKNPDLGFAVGQSHTDPEDKSIYVMSVVGGGAASSALKVGDKLLQVDGADLRSADLLTATSILNKTSNTVNLMVSRLQ